MTERLIEKNNSTFNEPLDGSWKSRFLFMWFGDQKRSHLEHYTGHNDFTKNGVHYVTWLDVVLNASGRPPILDAKMLLITLITVALTAVSIQIFPAPSSSTKASARTWWITSRSASRCCWSSAWGSRTTGTMTPVSSGG